MGDGKKGFVEKLFAEHGRALRAYIVRRVRSRSDAADLVQEVYLRMLQVSDTEAIRDPQLYLYTVARHVLSQHALRSRRHNGHVDVDDLSVQGQLGQLPALDTQLDARQMAEHLRAALGQLPAKWRIAIILQYRYGLTYEQIADRLGVSSNMVKKYLAQGIGRCQRLMAQLEIAR
jgi:RNA polymerase sigma-70 factor (ECF subfamily)